MIKIIKMKIFRYYIRLAQKLKIYLASPRGGKL